MVELEPFVVGRTRVEPSMKHPIETIPEGKAAAEEVDKAEVVADTFVVDELEIEVMTELLAVVLVTVLVVILDVVDDGITELVEVALVDVAIELLEVVLEDGAAGVLEVMLDDDATELPDMALETLLDVVLEAPEELLVTVERTMLVDGSVAVLAVLKLVVLTLVVLELVVL